MRPRGRRNSVNYSHRRGQDGTVEWQIIECNNRLEQVAAPFLDFLGIYRDRVGGSDARDSGLFDWIETGDNLALRGDVEVVGVEEEGLGSEIDLKLFEKWRGRVSDNLGLDTDLCLLSNFSKDKMLWKRVIARVRFEALYKTRFGRDSFNWRNWFLQPSQIFDDKKDDGWLPCEEEETVSLLNFVFVKETKEVIKKSEYDGPFSEAYKRIVKSRKENDKKDKGLVKWSPGEKRLRGVFMPSLSELSFAFLAEYCEGLVSLENIPLEMRHKLCRAACDYGKMNFEFLKVIIDSAPSEICVPDCCWMTTKQFIKLFFACDSKNLKVLHLAMGGQCNFDHAFMSDAFPSRVFFTLRSLSLRGAVQLTDKGLGSLVQLAPSLRSLDISHCPLISAVGINVLVIWYDKTLEELYIDDCPGIDAMAMLPALTKFLNLQVLSIARNYSVCDEFVCRFADVRGSSMKELVFSSCQGLTDETIKVIGCAGSSLVSLDISNISNLTDWALQYIANGFGSIRHLEISDNDFSDEAVAALLEVSGQYLAELSLKNICKVINRLNTSHFDMVALLLIGEIEQIGPATAFSLTNFTRNLLSLDLSQCKDITENMLGQIVNCCPSLRLLKLYGCSELSNRFLFSHSNPHLVIVGHPPLPQQETAW